LSEEEAEEGLSRLIMGHEGNDQLQGSSSSAGSGFESLGDHHTRSWDQTRF